MKKFRITKAQGYGYLFFPVDESLQKKINRHMKDMGEKPGPAYFQEIYDLEESFPDKKRQLKELAKGWDITILVGTWEALHAWGYDCHTIAENGGVK